MAEPTTLYLLHHGEIDRPPLAQFDEATLTPEGRRQIRELALSWEHLLPSAIYCSRLPRSVETASLCAGVFRCPVRVVDELEEWAATGQDVPDETYQAFERRCWREFSFAADAGESLAHARARIWRATRAIAERHRGGAVMISGHAVLFNLFLSRVRHVRATKQRKDRIGPGHYAIVEYADRFRLVRNFALGARMLTVESE